MNRNQQLTLVVVLVVVATALGSVPPSVAATDTVPTESLGTDQLLGSGLAEGGSSVDAGGRVVATDYPSHDDGDGEDGCTTDDDDHVDDDEEGDGFEFGDEDEADHTGDDEDDEDSFEFDDEGGEGDHEDSFEFGDEGGEDDHEDSFEFDDEGDEHDYEDSFEFGDEDDEDDHEDSFEFDDEDDEDDHEDSVEFDDEDVADHTDDDEDDEDNFEFDTHDEDGSAGDNEDDNPIYVEEWESESTDDAVEQSGPWGSDPVVIAVEAPDDGRDYTSLVNEATTFWEANDARYLGYEIDYEVDADARNPDLVVRFSDDIPECGGQADAVGCAPYITRAWQIDRPMTAYIRTGFSDDSTVEIIEHELGHTLGFAHGDGPADLMDATGSIHTLPRTNATEKAFPWDDSHFTVYVNDSGATDPDATREQVHHAFDYYDDGAPGMPDNLTFTYVDDPTEADIRLRVSFGETSLCAAGVDSFAAASGDDPDGDKALETYDTLGVVLVDPDTDAVGWHVGYWMAHYLGAEDDEDKPDSFQNATYSERRSEWWEHSSVDDTESNTRTSGLSGKFVSSSKMLQSHKGSSETRVKTRG